MHWLVYHIASGQAFFTGVVLVVIAAIASTRSRPIARRVAVLAFVIGAIAIAVSSTPFPYWFYGIALFVTVVWISSRFVSKWRPRAAYAMIAVWMIAVTIEIIHQQMPSLAQVQLRSITVIGDSVTAGMGGDEAVETWPRILSRKYNLAVQDMSHVGDTTGSALSRILHQEITSPIVVLEIGGNDMLGRTTTAEFAHDLNALLAHVCTPNRQAVMFELPLPPLSHEYGRIQRTLAQKHGVALVPKRIFLSVLAPEEATLDTIHLSQVGHERMAECVWRIVRPAFGGEH